MATGYVKVQPDGSCYTSVLSEAYFPCAFDIKNFPYDRQSCGLRVEAWIHSDAILNLDVKKNANLISKFAESQEYKLFDDGTSKTTTWSAITNAGWTRIIYKLGLARYTPPHSLCSRFSTRRTLELTHSRCLCCACHLPADTPAITSRPRSSHP